MLVDCCGFICCLAIPTSSDDLGVLYNYTTFGGGSNIRGLLINVCKHDARNQKVRLKKIYFFKSEIVDQSFTIKTIFFFASFPAFFLSWVGLGICGEFV